MQRFQRKFIFLLLISIFALPSSAFSGQDPPRWDCCWHIWAAGCNLGWATSLMYNTQSRQEWAGIPDQTISNFIVTAGESIAAANDVCSRVNPAWPGWQHQRNYLLNLVNSFRKRPNSVTRNQTYNSFGNFLRVVIIAGKKYDNSTCAEKYYRLGWLLSYAQQTLKISDEQRIRGNKKWDHFAITGKKYIKEAVNIIQALSVLRPVTGRCVNLQGLDLIARMSQLQRLPVTEENLRYMIFEVDRMWGQINQQITDDCSPETAPCFGQGRNNLVNHLSCKNNDNEENGCCCFKGTHTYRFVSQFVSSLLVRFDTGKKFNCRSEVHIQINNGKKWENIKTLQAVSSSGNSTRAPIDVKISINGNISGVKIFDGCVCCLDFSEIFME